MATESVIKYRLMTKPWFLRRCRELIGSFESEARFVRFLNRDDQWVHTPLKSWIEDSYDPPLDFYPIHGLSSLQNPVPEPWREDSDVYDPPYRQDIHSVWELYVFDSFDAILILPDEVELVVPRTWQVLEIMGGRSLEDSA